MKKIFGYSIVLVILIIAWSFFIRFFAGSETLQDYAEKNPEIAYATASPAQTPTPEPSMTPLPEASPTPAASPLPTASPETTSQGSQSSPERIVYQTDFYAEPLSEQLIAMIAGISYPLTESEAENTEVPVSNIVSDETQIAVTLEELRYLHVLHYDFNGEIQSGELICNQAIANDLLEIFYELYRNEYQIEKIKLIEEYTGDDTLSMLDNNTSCFNYRVVDGSTSLSKHAYGLAIDINPFYNPYVVYQKDGTTYISPQGSEPYTDRSINFPYKIDENDLCYNLFAERGFIWGGNWNSMKDYQHFQKTF